jgi:hypothetical protein
MLYSKPIDYSLEEFHQKIKMNGNFGTREYARAMGARIDKLLIVERGSKVIRGDSKAGHSTCKASHDISCGNECKARVQLEA